MKVLNVREKRRFDSNSIGDIRSIYERKSVFETPATGLVRFSSKELHKDLDEFSKIEITEVTLGFQGNQVFLVLYEFLDNETAGKFLRAKEILSKNTLTSSIKLQLIDLKEINDILLQTPKLRKEFKIQHLVDEQIINPNQKSQEYELEEKEPDTIDPEKTLSRVNVKKELYQIGEWLKPQFDVEEFYFQKALDVLDEIKTFDDVNEPISIDELWDEADNYPTANLAVLEMLWKSLGKDDYKNFERSLQSFSPSISVLYRLVQKFLSYVDYNAHAKNELNQYKDKRVIARTNVVYSHLISHFLEYALNGYQIPKDRSHLLFFRAMEYLENPGDTLAVLSDSHRKKISNFLFEREFLGKEFHKQVGTYFFNLGFRLKNGLNFTRFYSAIIYSKEFQELSKLKIEEDQEDNEKNLIGGNPTTKPKEKIKFKLDRVIEKDKLGRDPVAEAFATMVKEDIFGQEGMSHAFMVHLEGKWGSGKSSFMQFIKKHLNSGDEKWLVVDYNAWQNQHIKPPWWTLINQVYRGALDQLDFRPRQCLKLKERWRRALWYNSWKRLVPIVITALGLCALFSFEKEITDFCAQSELLSSLPLFEIITTIASVTAVFYTLSSFATKPLALNSSDSAKSFVLRSKDPMNRIKTHFEKLVSNINREKDGKVKRQLAIFIDDIDRCNKEFVVQLLEGIQTLFKDKKVLYIIAGEKSWITQSFGNTYEEFSNEGQNPQQLGEKFIEKAFQLSIRMPNVSDEAKQSFWNDVIGHEENNEGKQEKVDKETIEKIERKLEKATEEIRTPEYMKTVRDEFNVSQDVVAKSIIKKTNENNEEFTHLLAKFYPHLSSNPRSIIRLSNSYSMTRNTLIAEDKYVESDKIFRWLLMEQHYPWMKVEEIEELGVRKYFEKFRGNKISRKHYNDLMFLGADSSYDLLRIEEIKKIKGI